MKNKIRFLAMMLIGVLLSVNQVWGATATFGKSDFTSSNGTISATKDGVSVSCVGNIPSSGTYVTFTENNSLTISSTSGNITAIDFTCTTADYTGNLEDVSGISTTSWSITVDNPGNKTTVRVSSITVTYSSTPLVTYTDIFSGQKVDSFSHPFSHLCKS